MLLLLLTTLFFENRATLQPYDNITRTILIDFTYLERDKDSFISMNCLTNSTLEDMSAWNMQSYSIKKYTIAIPYFISLVDDTTFDSEINFDVLTNCTLESVCNYYTYYEQWIGDEKISIIPRNNETIPYGIVSQDIIADTIELDVISSIYGKGTGFRFYIGSSRTIQRHEMILIWN